MSDAGAGITIGGPKKYVASIGKEVFLSRLMTMSAIQKGYGLGHPIWKEIAEQEEREENTVIMTPFGLMTRREYRFFILTRCTHHFVPNISSDWGDLPEEVREKILEEEGLPSDEKGNLAENATPKEKSSFESMKTNLQWVVWGVDDSGNKYLHSYCIKGSQPRLFYGPDSHHRKIEGANEGLGDEFNPKNMFFDYRLGATATWTYVTGEVWHDSWRNCTLHAENYTGGDIAYYLRAKSKTSNGNHDIWIKISASGNVTMGYSRGPNSVINDFFEDLDIGLGIGDWVLLYKKHNYIPGIFLQKGVYGETNTNSLVYLPSMDNYHMLVYLLFGVWVEPE